MKPPPLPRWLLCLSDDSVVFADPFEALTARLLDGLSPGPHARRLQGVKGGAGAHVVARTLELRPRPSLVVCADTKRAEAFADALRFFLDEERNPSPITCRVRVLPAWDVIPFEDISPPPEVVAARIESLYQLRQGVNPIVITTPDALLQRVPPLADFASRYRYVVCGDEIDRDELAKQLDEWGYRRVSLVENRADFGIRGGIIDVFPPAHGNPVRLQLDGDRVESMHEFDPVSQRLIRAQEDLLLLPVREFSRTAVQRKEVLRAIEQRAEDLEIGRGERKLILEGLASGLLFPGVEFCLPYFYENLGSVFDYLPANTLLWIDAPGEVEVALERSKQEVKRRAAERAAERRFFPPPELLYDEPAAYRATVEKFPRIELEPLDVLASPGDSERLSVRCFTTADLEVKRGHHRHEISFGPVAVQIRKWQAENYRVVLVAGTRPQAERIARLLETNDVAAVVQDRPFRDALTGAADPVPILIGHLQQGFRLPDAHLSVVTDTDIFGETRRRAARVISVTQLLKNLSELQPNDYVVHLDHGIGIYRGLRHLQVAGTEGDYLHLEYFGGDRLYLPVDRISLVQKYVGADGTAPALDKLGGGSWERVKAKTRESVLAMARELLAVHAARQINERKPYTPPDSYFREFEAAFPFEETPDQKQAIDDVISDMQKPHPMDRLICGDVGYGKTEVALRAAFLAVSDSRQVAVLVPTTILAEQHLTTFRKRFDGYPVRVEMLSRFLTPAQAKKVLRGLADGTVDIVIGTHRLLQKDVEFKRLGLLVVDEEHRFGVRHKERIKEIRKLVDVVTLTATPIPRTLQMAVTGIRELSVIETPPVDRLAIRTYVTRYDDDLIRDAIQRELRRNGQVFFVHNRVENIDIMERHLRQLVPEARFGVAHGQMNERELERVMLAFINREIDVLVCTAIIESGLDIPRANTILINRADHFGLAQLYQLRGRVGRSHERAYAYLMIPGEHLITRDAQKRLQVLQELDDLGGGFRLAAHDLEIRGAGNLLGKQQSGQVAAVGFELYTHMLEQAVRELRGERMQTEVEPEIQLGFPAFIPDSYVPDENQRVVFYRRLAGIRGPQDLEDIRVELTERYGPVPPLVDSFLRVMDLRRSLKDTMVVRAVNGGGVIQLQFHPEAPVDVDKLLALAKSRHGKFKVSEDYQIAFRPDATDWDGIVQEIQEVLQRIRA